jgi:hypothetical protein
MNNQNTTVLFPYEPEELWEKIRELFRSELQKSKATNEPPVAYEVPGLVQKPVYKAHEVCAIFQISRQTLHAWVKEGVLRQYKVKSRVFFLWNDIEKLISTPKQ